MNKKVWKSIFMLCFIVFSISVFSQNPNVKGIIAGTNRMYLVSFNSGQVIKGKITSIDKENIYIQEGNQDPRSYVLADVISVDVASSQYKASLGFGIGISYGTIGINGEFFAHPNVSLNLGVGTAIFITPIIDAGCKLYFTGAEKKWRPRASVYYGTNAIIWYSGDSYLPDIREKLNNVSFGIGQAWVLGSGNRGLDLDIMYLVHNGAERLEEYINMGYDFDLNAMGHIKLNIGYRLYF
ncbi:MAG: hypothetical protein JXA77_19170 [Bacteroidales bacterium]|nr:hypothetical protein [Bacteroidales bacterium]MBN2821412.1 hypothetical protein [Bacteroidales bacterium]